MRKIIMMMSVSIDGFMSGPAGELDWHRVDDEVHTHFNERLGAMGAFLDGRVSWQLMAGFWPTVDEDPAADAPAAEFAGIWRDMPKIVYSRTLTEAGWNTTIEREVDPARIEQLKAQPGGDLALGGAKLAATFREHELIDDYSLYVMPVLLGAGVPMFGPGARADLRLVETRTFGNGVVLLRYER